MWLYPTPGWLPQPQMTHSSGPWLLLVIQSTVQCNVWVTTDGGASWQDTQFDVAAGTAGGLPPIQSAPLTSPQATVAAHDIAVGTRVGDNASNFRIFVLQSGGFTGWLPQNLVNLRLTSGTLVTRAIWKP